MQVNNNSATPSPSFNKAQTPGALAVTQPGAGLGFLGVHSQPSLMFVLRISFLLFSFDVL